MQNELLRRAAAMNIPMTEEMARKLETYHNMLTAANAQFNLTRVPEDIGEAIDRNYLDCAAPVKLLPPDVKTCVDVGSGAGFPAIPMAICRPDLHIVLIDSLTKRVDFLRSVIIELHLNAEAIHSRAEDAARRADLRDAFDLAMARAVAPMNVLCEYLLPFVKCGGWMMALKGPGLDAEIQGAAHAMDELCACFDHTDRVNIPNRDWDHRICWIRKCAATPDKYPRKAGRAEKKPL